MEFKKYCGLDIHKDKYVACLVDNKGKELSNGSFPSTKDALRQFLSGIDNTSCVVIIENCGMWRFAYNILKELGFYVKLCDGNQTKRIVGHKKTDHNDAKVLANLARTNYLQELYIPPNNILKLRDLCHHLRSLRDIRVIYKNKIKGELIKQGIKYINQIWNIKGYTWLKSLNLTTTTSLVILLEQLNKQEKEIHNQVIKSAKTIKSCKLLMTIPGIAEYLSLVIYSEIGTISRFKNIKNLHMYSGLCPGIYQTGNTEKSVKNNNSNRFLKYAFVEASGSATIHNESFKNRFVKYNKKKGYPTARRVIARHMATIVWHILSKQEKFKFA